MTRMRRQARGGNVYSLIPLDFGVALASAFGWVRRPEMGRWINCVS